MKIAGHFVDAIKSFGYTDAEARFLYIVATHSGYFTTRHFLAFTGSQRGFRTRAFGVGGSTSPARYDAMSTGWM